MFDLLQVARWTVEGINKIKAIERMARGFRNDADVFLKIRAACARNP